eukprot:CAMPEP_0114576242 /NCGR_PEP_ID=MMETSP0125-20121206/1028_1 /TAXON_ID=485358 ORGANISM="Aristerostoma sp., Strain ATCC 50986" /NCGR_SAMPLE_ID=MMETSP0125 /ASSEMBLY_ACC=CAM_ASM_000245 /LENGTH=157 /DNA_ID=CAMNT_0001764609 /DNA_START=857 /DNA_END=1330 /DNA_ORIENTATION=+
MSANRSQEVEKRDYVRAFDCLKNCGFKNRLNLRVNIKEKEERHDWRHESLAFFKVVSPMNFFDNLKKIPLASINIANLEDYGKKIYIQKAIEFETSNADLIKVEPQRRFGGGGGLFGGGGGGGFFGGGGGGLFQQNNNNNNQDENEEEKDKKESPKK